MIDWDKKLSSFPGTTIQERMNGLLDSHKTVLAASQAIGVSRSSLATKMVAEGVKEKRVYHNQVSGCYGDNIDRSTEEAWLDYMKDNPYYLDDLASPMQSGCGHFSMWAEAIIIAIRDAGRGDQVAKEFLNGDITKMILDIMGIDHDRFEAQRARSFERKPKVFRRTRNDNRRKAGEDRKQVEPDFSDDDADLADILWHKRDGC